VPAWATIRRAFGRIDDPDAADAEPQILRDLGAHPPEAIARRQDLDREVRRQLRPGSLHVTGRVHPIWLDAKRGKYSRVIELRKLKRLEPRGDDP
jgi:hypothetical protein